MRRKVLIVEDHELNRRILHNILKQDYDVLEAENGVVALEILMKEYSSISAVILDIVMPQMDGFEVLSRMHDNPDMAQIPVIVATGSEDQDGERKALRAGAIDYITKPYDQDILKNRLCNTILLREQAAIVNATRWDALTGLMSRAAFFERAREMVEEKPKGYYIMASFDIDRFRVINDQYGTKKGDDVLKQIASVFQNDFSKEGGIVSRINADHFAVLYPASFSKTKEIEAIRQKASELDDFSVPLSFAIGRYVIEDVNLEPSAMYDRAVMAKESIKGRYDEHVGIYDEKMRDRILKEQDIISEMNSALAAHQFEVWYQPQFNHVTKALVGAEALVRWRHPAKGIISPGLFIPIFEKNGFVYEVDKYVWEQVCIFLSDRKAKGLKVTPVSVNISRYDVFREDLISVMEGLVKKYDIPVDWLRLEITESAFSKSADQIIRVVNAFKELGFTMEIDDFGSGYSSLNTLKDVPADVIKLDMRFLEGDDNKDKGGNILESIIRMARWIGMSVIAEGVEEKEQADFLKSVGCYYIQGYFYSKPLPKADYEKLIAEHDCTELMSTIESVETYDSEAFWNPKSIETLIFNSFVGGACVFEYQEDKIEIIRVNERYVRILRNTNENPDVIRLNWEEYVTPESLRRSKEIMKKAIATGAEVSDEMELKDYAERGKSIFIAAKMRVIARTQNRYLFYCVLEDVTAQREAEQIEREAIIREKENDMLMHLIVDNVANGVTAVELDGNSVKYLFANEQYYTMLGYTKEQYIREVKDPYLLFHPDDKDKIYGAVHKLTPSNPPLMLEYRAYCRDGFLKSFRTFVVNTEYRDHVIQLSVFEDITMERQEEERQKELLENIPCGAGIFDISDGSIRAIYLNKKYWELVGREPNREELFPVMDSILLEDRAYLPIVIQRIVVSGKEQECEIHVLNGDGHYIPFLVRGNVMKNRMGRMTLYVTYTSIDESALPFRQMLPYAVKAMMSSAKDICFVKDRALKYVCVSHTFAKLVGYEDENEIIGKTDGDLFDKAVADTFRADDQKVIKNGTSIVDYVERISEKNSKLRYMCTSKYVLRDVAGNIIGLYGTSRDVTESMNS